MSGGIVIEGFVDKLHLLSALKIIHAAEGSSVNRNYKKYF